MPSVLGRMLGVDSVLIYRIDGPTLRDRFFAHTVPRSSARDHYEQNYPSREWEVVYHNVVTARVDETEGSGWSLSDNVDYQRWSREAVDQRRHADSLTICATHLNNRVDVTRRERTRMNHRRSCMQQSWDHYGRQVCLSSR